MSGPTLIVGASSKLGRPIVRLLRDEGRAVRAMTRTPSRLESLRALGAEVIEGDLRDPASLVRACDGIECVIASAHALHGRGDNDAIAVDQKGHRNMIDAAVAAGVKRFLFASAYGAGPDHPIDFFRIKYETEQALEASGMACTSVRGTSFVETWLEIFGKMLAERGRVMIFGPGTNAWNFVSVEDLSRILVLAANRDDTIGRAIEVGGPQDLTMRQIVGILESVTARRIKRTHLPILSLRVMSPLIRPFHSGVSRILQTGILMNTPPATLDWSATYREFGIEPTRFEDVARRRASELGQEF